MSDPTRRPRGAAKASPVVYGHVCPEAKGVVETTSSVLGISQAQAIEAILLALELDEDGVPTILYESRPPARKRRSNHKGERTVLLARAPIAIAEAARTRATQLGLSMSDYLTELVARDVDMRELAPTLSSTAKGTSARVRENSEEE